MIIPGYIMIGTSVLFWVILVIVVGRKIHALRSMRKMQKMKRMKASSAAQSDYTGLSTDYDDDETNLEDDIEEVTTGFTLNILGVPDSRNATVTSVIKKPVF